MVKSATPGVALAATTGAPGALAIAVDPTSASFTSASGSTVPAGADKVMFTPAKVSFAGVRGYG